MEHGGGGTPYGAETPVPVSVSDTVVPDAYRILAEPLAIWLQRASESDHTEVEAKLGTLSSDGASDGRFSSEVPAEFFVDKLKQFHATPPDLWTTPVITEESITYQFANGVRGTQYRDGRAEFVRKVTQSHLDFENGDATGTDGADPVLRHFRLSHNLELKCDAPCAEIRWVRLRRRTSFVYKYWRFDFTYTRQGATKEMAMRARIQHEIELELVRTKPLPGDDYTYLAVGTLLKIQDLLSAPADLRTVRALHSVASATDSTTTTATKMPSPPPHALRLLREQNFAA